MPDDATVVEGDAGFLGMASRLNPVQLQPGMCQLVENMRLDRGVAQTRKGAKRVASGIALGDVELTLPFQLGADKTISSITYLGTTATATCTAHGYATGNFVNIRGAAQPEYNGDFTVTNTGANTFRYSMAAQPVSNATGTLVANKGPLVKTTYSGGVFASGVYSSPRFDLAQEYIVLCAPGAAFLWRQGQTLQTISYPLTEIFESDDDITVLQAFDKIYLHRSRPSLQVNRVTSVAVSGTEATVSLTAHGLTTNDVVRISGADQAGLLADFAVDSVPNANSFRVTVPKGTANGTGVIFAQRVLPTLVWDGDLANDFVRVGVGTHPLGVSYSRMPAGSVATYYNNFTAIVRGRDEILISDVLDAETYDPMLKNFRANFGSNDYIVGIHPYASGQALVFGRKSIYLANIVISSDGVNIEPWDSSLQLLTNEIGCVARKTIATAGTFVFFLSDSGVYQLDNQLDLKLRGNTQPLSDPIADILTGINGEFAHRSIGLYFGNRYYLAVPMGDSEVPNAVLSYNMLNQQWEYRDTFAFEFDQLLVSDYDSRRRLYAINRNGGIFLLDEIESGEDDTQSGVGTDYQGGSLRTRRYGWGSLNAKRLLRAKCSLVLPAGAACALDAVTTDYDNDFQIAALVNSTKSEEDYTLKAPLRTKATYLDLRFRTTAGRPVLRNISAEAARSAMDPTETRTLN